MRLRTSLEDVKHHLETKTSSEDKEPVFHQREWNMKKTEHRHRPVDREHHHEIKIFFSRWRT